MIYIRKLKTDLLQELEVLEEILEESKTQDNPDKVAYMSGSIATTKHHLEWVNAHINEVAVNKEIEKLIKEA